MSNKIITFSTQLVSSYLGETFVDIDMNSRFSDDRILKLIDDKDFTAFLGVENTNHLCAIANEDNKNEVLRIYYSEYLNDQIAKHNATLSTYNILKLVNVNAIKNSMHNIFSWIQGERILQPEFGSRLRLMLYEGITDRNQEMIAAEIRHCVLKWEPRVSVQDIINLTTIDDKENNTVHLKIVYTIPALSLTTAYSTIYNLTIS